MHILHETEPHLKLRKYALRRYVIAEGQCFRTVKTLNVMKPTICILLSQEMLLTNHTSVLACFLA
jgi:hypothetical protein